MTSSKLESSQLSNCDKEPIHIPGAIQPHGALLVLEPISLVCIQASENCQDLLGISCQQLLNRPITSLPISEHHSKLLLQVLQSPDPSLESPLQIQIQNRHYDCLIHTHDSQIILEFEVADLTHSPARHNRHLQRVFDTLRNIPDLSSFYQVVAKFIADFTGFERVMVYKFDTDWHGEVVGEHLLTHEVASYFGHHFPAGDIPAQARALYTRNWLRLIPTSTYRPVSIQPPIDPRTQRPTDLSYSVLRSVSPVHLEYLRNMDVGASMSISLIINGQLWGLIACHHREPRPLPYSIRSACEIFGQIVSLEISARQDTKRLSLITQATRIQTRFFEVISREQNFVEALIKYTPELLSFMQASGAAIYVNDKLTLLGKTPNETQARELIEWLNTQSLTPLLATDYLSELHPPSKEYTRTSSGLLALRLSRVDPHYILWFRPEVITTVTWAGNPDKSADANLLLHPRKSFAAWKQTVTAHSQPWTTTELQGAKELLTAINALVLRRTERLIRLNEELERKNTDLNSFAHIASHDLKEPLRGISHYSSFISEDHADILPPQALQKLQTIKQLSNHSIELLEALNHFSKLGRIEPKLKPVPLDNILDLTLSLLEIPISQQQVKIIRPSSLPIVECDPVLVREVLYNLIHNAIHYNLNHPKLVEIGYIEADPNNDQPESFFIRDNGIGIRPKHFHAVFDIFRRLHPQGEFGNGIGAGLAISKNIIERHGGKIWIDSTFGQGSTFHFTLGKNIR